MQLKKVLFICMGNICRSPSAEAVFLKMIKQKGFEQSYQIDSAGTHSYHMGSKPDRRSVQAAKKRGVEMDHLRARQVVADDFNRFDFLVVMDEDNRANLSAMFPRQPQDKVFSMMRFAKEVSYQEVPDPYYGEGEGFELVLDLLEQSCAGLLSYIESVSPKS